MSDGVKTYAECKMNLPISVSIAFHTSFNQCSTTYAASVILGSGLTGILEVEGGSSLEPQEQEH